VSVLEQIDSWDVPHVAAAVLDPSGAVLEQRGPTGHRFRLASISKLLAAYAVMIGVEEEAVTLDDEVGPPGATLRHLLAHTSGLGFESTDRIRVGPGERRIYSNYGIELAAAHLAAVTGIPFARYLDEAVFRPLAMTATALEGSPAHAVHSSVDDLTAFVRELCSPRLLAPQTLAGMITVQFPGVAGFVPGVRRFDPCDWGLGFERNFGKLGHWAGERLSAESFGHFGGAGTLLWVDPVAGAACICLTDRPFDQWAMEVWPPLGDAVVNACGRQGPGVAVTT
jgi:CubicO group peptidase (beta-lactamase class C family)